MQIFHKLGHQFGGTLMVAGISLGVGMLALPIATAQAGFIPSLFIYLFTWLFMISTGFLILEACLWMPKDANLITLSHRLLGKWGRAACWILYLFLFSSLMVAHVAGGGTVLAEFSEGLIATKWALLIYVLLISPVVYLGALWVDRFNILLMIGVVLTYLFFVIISVPHIKADLLLHANWAKMSIALPVVFTAFGYQSLIPTLLNYMHRDPKKVRKAIVFGTSIPLAIYTIWEFLILGIIPLEGPHGLLEALASGLNAINPLKFHIQHAGIVSAGRLFAFFVLTTSYIGISIAFVDFLADGLKVSKTGLKKFSLCVFIFGLPTLICLYDPTLFIRSLTYAGGFGVALLLGLLPILMVWSGRYLKGYPTHTKQLPGGKAFLVILFLFVIFELITQIIALFV